MLEGPGTLSVDNLNLVHYLKSLSGDVLHRLYAHPASCIVVFRELSELAKHFIMRTLFIDQSVPQAVVTSWVKSSQQKSHDVAVKLLSDLNIWEKSAIPGGLKGWRVTDSFRKHLQVALQGEGKAWIGAGILEEDKHSRDTDHLEKYAIDRWECVLHFLVGSQVTDDTISKEIVSVIISSGLMKCDREGGTPALTPAGFHFLLMDTRSQVWYFMLQYMHFLQASGADVVEVLTFLFQLSFITFGKDYTTENMTEPQLQFLQTLRELGIVLQRKRKSKRFYPTQLAVNLATGLTTQQQTLQSHGYIVIETNFRIYAYTDSSLQVALIALFCEMIYRFPNMCVAMLTRDSVRQALQMGITAEQIINFIQTHAHPQMLNKVPLIPPAICDQVRLWELETDRLSYTEGVLYNQFLSQSDFELLRDYARDMGVLIQESPAKRLMVVSKAGHDSVKRFWKRHRHKTEM